jgi:transposase
MNICPQCRMAQKEDFLKLMLEDRWPAWRVAQRAGVHENTIYNWKGSYEKGGFKSLADDSRAPKNHPNALDDSTVEIIKKIRIEGRRQEKRYLGEKVIAHRLKRDHGIVVSCSGIGKVLLREGLIPEKNKRRRPKKERVKKCRIHEPGELLQMDVKYAVKSYENHWFYQYDAIDYVSGVVMGDIFPLQSNYEAVKFLRVVIKRSPFSVLGMQTDNHSTFTNYYTGYKKSADPSKPKLHAFDLNCAQLGIVHYLIDPGSPAQNGKIERFHRTCEEELYQHNTFKDLNSLRKKFRDYLYYYNHEREHQGLDMMTPLEKLRSFPGYEKVTKITN